MIAHARCMYMRGVTLGLNNVETVVMLQCCHGAVFVVNARNLQLNPNRMFSMRAHNGAQCCVSASFVTNGVLERSHEDDREVDQVSISLAAVLGPGASCRRSVASLTWGACRRSVVSIQR